ncbi:hypothetical protein SLS62_001598 [Diatrype stigma]|uniref:Uncharacterized protein n=1 Tax=Diatrype stigma TaxID=117547 RepID=A0AAN9UZS1_9PEZI
MSTGGAGADSGRLYKYGTSGAGASSNGDLTEEQAREINARYRGTDKASKSSSSSGGGGILNSLKEALRPGDSRRPGGAAGKAEDRTGRRQQHGGIAETVQPGKRDNYHDNDSKNNGGSGSGSGARRGIMGTVKQALGGRDRAHAHAHAPESYRDATGSSAGAFGSSHKREAPPKGAVRRGDR